MPVGSLFSLSAFPFCSSKRKSPKEAGVIFLNGTSSAGKSHICAELQSMCQNLKYLGEDQVYTFDDYIPSWKMGKFEKAHKMNVYARRLAESGKIVVVDQVDLFRTYFNDASDVMQNVKFNYFLALVYCQFTELPERINNRNNEGVETELRSFWRTLAHYACLFTGQQQKSEYSLEYLSRKDFEAALTKCHEYDQWGSRRHRDERLKEAKWFLLKMLNFGEHDGVYITPRFHYDVVIDTTRTTSKAGATVILNELDRRQRSPTYIPSVLSVRVEDSLATATSEDCMECQIPHKSKNRPAATRSYCNKCLLHLQKLAHVDFTKDPPMYNYTARQQSPKIITSYSTKLNKPAAVVQHLGKPTKANDKPPESSHVAELDNNNSPDFENPLSAPAEAEPSNPGVLVGNSSGGDVDRDSVRLETSDVEADGGEATTPPTHISGSNLTTDETQNDTTTTAEQPQPPSEGGSNLNTSTETSTQAAVSGPTGTTATTEPTPDGTTAAEPTPDKVAPAEPEGEAAPAVPGQAVPSFPYGQELAGPTLASPKAPSPTTNPTVAAPQLGTAEEDLDEENETFPALDMAIPDLPVSSSFATVPAAGGEGEEKKEAERSGGPNMFVTNATPVDPLSTPFTALVEDNTTENSSVGGMIARGDESGSAFSNSDYLGPNHNNAPPKSRKRRGKRSARKPLSEPQFGGYSGGSSEEYSLAPPSPPSTTSPAAGIVGGTNTSFPAAVWLPNGGVISPFMKKQHHTVEVAQTKNTGDSASMSSGASLQHAPKASVPDCTKVLNHEIKTPEDTRPGLTFEEQPGPDEEGQMPDWYTLRHDD
eukprot:TRINITY_DN67173_c0_g2_i1.p1 TRINITY_DN67173_c0_g2~~TRINITY_DN67173_c0_g2_i1.p1  ORF type:complete len:828 (+),score=69.76 TRINITY_DN67173_c0_g2_i1:23-2485(+)